MPRYLMWLCLVFTSSCYASAPFEAKSSFSSSSAWSNQEKSSWQSQYNRPTDTNLPPFYSIVARYSSYYKVPRKLVFAIIETESHFNSQAVSHAGAKGLMQLMDMHSRRWKIDPFDPEANVMVGTHLIATLLQKYESLPLALAAYNAGEPAVLKYKGVPPYKETREYITRVMAKMRKYK